jgi:DNA-3-methyladenine glycosylase II
LSERKAGYLHALAQRFRDGSLHVERWPEWQDEAVIEDLIQVRGIGRWTAEMFLIFHLLRPNVLPLGDLGLQNAIRLHYGNGRALSAKRMRKLASSWAPWCSVATWFLWRSLDPVPVEY